MELVSSWSKSQPPQRDAIRSCQELLISSIAAIRADKCHFHKYVLNRLAVVISYNLEERRTAAPAKIFDVRVELFGTRPH